MKWITALWDWICGKARDFIDDLKAAGRDLGDCAIVTALQNAYAAWKELHR